VIRQGLKLLLRTRYYLENAVRANRMKAMEQGRGTRKLQLYMVWIDKVFAAKYEMLSKKSVFNIHVSVT
jgi:hypothetical protein